MKRLACILLCFLLFCAALSGFSAQAMGATEAKISAKTTKTTYLIGEEFSVTLNTSCGAALKSFNVTLAFDENVLEFLSEKTKHIPGVNGEFQQYIYNDRLRLTYTYNGSGTILSGKTSEAITIYFKVKTTASAGTTSLTPSVGTIIEDNTRINDPKAVINRNSAVCTVTYSAARITISTAESMKANAKLASLTVKNCTLRPKFDENTKEYDLYVPDSVSTITPIVETVNIDATAKIKPVTKDNKVDKVNIVVTAADKTTTNTYVLKIKNGDPPSTTATSQPSSDPSSEPSSTVTSAPETTSPPEESESSSEETSPEAAANLSDPSSDDSSDSSEGFLSALRQQAVTLLKNGPLLLILGGFVILVLLLVALPLSKHKKRKYINQLLRRGYIINPQLPSVYGGMTPPPPPPGVPPSNIIYRP